GCDRAVAVIRHYDWYAVTPISWGSVIGPQPGTARVGAALAAAAAERAQCESSDAGARERVSRAPVGRSMNRLRRPRASEQLSRASARPLLPNEEPSRANERGSRPNA